VHDVPRETVLRVMDDNIRGERKTCYISITSSELLYNSRRSSFIPAFIQGARFSLADSISVVFAAALHRTKIRRFPGPELMEVCSREGVQRGWRHYYCGGADGVAEGLSRKLEERFPGMVTAGICCPPFRALEPNEEESMLERINAAKPDILWVGLGVVKQEMWIERYLDRLHVPWIVGVGGAFDFHAGTVRRAPTVLQRCGLEWAYRLYLEPWRFKRISSSFVFMLEATLESLLGRAPLLGGTDHRDTPPTWRGKRSA